MFENLVKKIIISKKKYHKEASTLPLETKLKMIQDGVPLLLELERIRKQTTDFIDLVDHAENSTLHFP